MKEISIQHAARYQDMFDSHTTPSSGDDLFRDEVLKAHTHAGQGRILLNHPMSSLVIATVSVILFAILVIFAFTASVTRKAHVNGIVQPADGTVSLLSPVTGTIFKVLVAEGATVNSGDKILELATERQGSAGEISALVSQQLGARLDALTIERRNRLQQAQEKRRSISEQLKANRDEHRQVEEELAAYTRRVQLAEVTLQRYRVLEGEGFVSEIQTQQRQEELLDLVDKLSNIRRAEVQVEANRKNLLAEQTDIETSTNMALSAIDGNIASVRQEIAENDVRGRVYVTASTSGIVSTITYKPGQSVTNGQPIVTLMPSSSTSPSSEQAFEIQLFVPSRSAGFVRPGQIVELRYDAYPYQKFGLQKGTVVSVSRTPFAPNELPQSLASTVMSGASQLSVQQGEALYRIVVQPLRRYIVVYGAKQHLKAGMTVQADILVDKRKVWEWALEPILAYTNRVAD